jgi:AraC-like DNA-binding protein
MKEVDTTNPKAHAGALSLLSDPGTYRAFQLTSGFRTRLIGMYYCKFGLDWDSAGACESDYVHHIDIPLSGKRQVIHGDRRLELKPGYVYFLPANTPVARRCQRPGSVLYMKFRCEWIPGMDPLMDWPERTPAVIEELSRKEWTRWLAPRWRTGGNHLLVLHAQLERWLASVLPPLPTLISRHLETHARFTTVYELVEKKLGADLRIAELARIHGTSLHAFSRAFAAATGLTPKEYLNRRLNQEALQLIANTDLKVKEIADRLRFSDEFYFSRFFQKLNRVSPSAYRALFRTVS